MTDKIVDMGYSFKPVRREDFDARLAIIRVEHRKRLDQRVIKRFGVTLGTVFLVAEDPVAFYGSDGTHYVRAT